MFTEIRRFDRIDPLDLGGRGEADVFAAVAHLESLYPGFDAWLHGKVFPGMRDGTRRIFTAIKDQRVQAVAIAKRTAEEQKLCTLWVAPHARTFGLAQHLAAEAFDWLATTKPLFTVPDAKIAEFKPLLSRWEFTCAQVVSDAYRPGSREFVFNGEIRRPS